MFDRQALVAVDHAGPEDQPRARLADVHIRPVGDLLEQLEQRELVVLETRVLLLRPDVLHDDLLAREDRQDQLLTQILVTLELQRRLLVVREY